MTTHFRADWDICDIDIDWKTKGWPKNTFNSINRDLTDSLQDLIYDFDTLVASNKAICPPVHKLNTKIVKLVADIKALEKKHKAPSNSIWNHLVDEGKI